MRYPQVYQAPKPNTMLKLGTQVKCIDARGAGGYLVNNRTYTIDKETTEAMGSYYHINGNGWSATRFVILGCPCQVKNCIASHKTKDQ